MKNKIIIALLVIAITVPLFGQSQQSVFAEKINHGKIPILMYHHLSYDSSKWSSSVISPVKFREEMLYLKVLGFTPIHFKDYIAYKEKGATLPQNPIIITFDDGYYSNYQYAYPILKELNMKATISIIGWSMGRKYDKDGRTLINEHFTWDQAREMYNSGLVDIQHHTFDLHSLDDNIISGKGISKKNHETEKEYKKRFKEDTVKMKLLIESEIGNEVIVYTYPYGISNPMSEKIIKGLGFKCSLSTVKGISDMDNSLFLLNRINMPPNIPSPKLMEEILKLQGQDMQIPYSDISDQEKRIQKLEQFLEL